MSICSSELLHNFPSDFIRVIAENRTVSNRSPTSLRQGCTEYRCSLFPLPQLSQTAGMVTVIKGESNHTTHPLFSVHTCRYRAMRAQAAPKVTTQHKSSFMQGVLPEIRKLSKIWQRFFIMKYNLLPYRHTILLPKCDIHFSTDRVISQTRQGILVTCKP